MERSGFFKRHSRLLSFMGALIVFMTFVTKEQLEERWHATAEALEMAQYFYEVRAEADAAEQDRMDLKARIDLLPHTSIVGDVPVNFRLKLGQEEHTALVANTEKSVLAELATIEILVGKLPDHKGIDRSIEELKKKVDQMQIDYKASLDALKESVPADATIVGVGTPKQAPITLQSIRLSLMAALRGYALEKEAKALDERVLNEAKQLRTRDESRARLAGWVSAVLYVLGWGLGLAGRLQGGMEAVEMG